jgi:hypothetical protein
MANQRGQDLIEFEESHDRRAPWERPVLRRLAANNAEGGVRPCNDSGGPGSGCGPSTVMHS